MNYYPFHIGDYLSATRHLSWAEDAAYRRLLDTYYTTEKALPLDLRAVCRLVLATTEEQREAVRVVLEEFFEQTADGWKNSRADAEIEAMRDKQQKQRDKANKRWHKQAQELGNASAMPQQANTDAAASKSDADAMPPTPTPTPTPTPNTAKAVGASRRKPQTALPEDFAPNDVGMSRAAEKHLDVPTELEKFRNHHAAKGSVMADWQAAWRTWVGNARPGVARSQQRPHDREAADRADPRPQWALDAGFANVYEARNEGCNERTAHLFRGGKRIEVAA